MNPLTLTGLETWILEGHFPNTAFIYRRQLQQSTAAISTSKAEDQAMAAAVKEDLYRVHFLMRWGGKWLTNIYQWGQRELHHEGQECCHPKANETHRCDVPLQKESCHVKANELHRYEVQVEDETFELQYCPTEIMQADLLTKSLCKTKVDQKPLNFMAFSLTLDKASSSWVGLMRSEHFDSRQIKCRFSVWTSKLIKLVITKNTNQVFFLIFDGT